MRFLHVYSYIFKDRGTESRMSNLLMLISYANELISTEGDAEENMREERVCFSRGLIENDFV